MVTKISASVIGANAVTETSIGSNVIIARHLANSAVQSRHLGAGLDASTVQDNVAAAEANIILVDANVKAITDTTTDLNIGSGKYFFDKSATSLGIDNTTPILTSITLGNPANVVINYGESGATGNISIGGSAISEGYRLNVFGSANVGTLTVSSFTPAGAMSITDATATSDKTTGALKVTGGISTQADLGVGDDIFMDSDGAIINMGDNNDVSITHIHDTGIAVNLGVGLAGNTAPTATGMSLGTPANVIIRAVGGKGGNVIIGDATATTGHLLDVRGTANVGALTTTGAITTTGIIIGSASINETELEILDGATLSTTDLNILDGATLSTTELNYVDGVTSAIQTQLAAHTTEDTAIETR